MWNKAQSWVNDTGCLDFLSVLLPTPLHPHPPSTPTYTPTVSYPSISSIPSQVTAQRCCCVDNTGCLELLMIRCPVPPPWEIKARCFVSERGLMSVLPTPIPCVYWVSYPPLSPTSSPGVCWVPPPAPNVSVECPAQPPYPAPSRVKAQWCVNGTGCLESTLNALPPPTTPLCEVTFKLQCHVKEEWLSVLSKLLPTTTLWSCSTVLHEWEGLLASVKALLR